MFKTKVIEKKNDRHLFVRHFLVQVDELVDVVQEVVEELPGRSGIQHGQIFLKEHYSGGSNTEHLNSESIRKPNVFLFRFGMVRFSNGPFQYIERTI